MRDARGSYCERKWPLVYKYTYKCSGFPKFSPKNITPVNHHRVAHLQTRHTMRQSTQQHHLTRSMIICSVPEVQVQYGFC